MTAFPPGITEFPSFYNDTEDLDGAPQTYIDLSNLVTEASAFANAANAWSQLANTAAIDAEAADADAEAAEAAACACANAAAGWATVSMNYSISAQGAATYVAQAIATWESMPYVTYVAGRTGNVTLSVVDVAGAAPLSNPAFSGVPTAPSPPLGDVSNTIATTSFVSAQISNSIALVNGGTFVTTAFANATYLKLAGGTMTGPIHAVSPPVYDSQSNVATTAWVQQLLSAANPAAWTVQNLDVTVGLYVYDQISCIPTWNAYISTANATGVFSINMSNTNYNYRWTIQKNPTPETGSGIGSDLTFYGWNDPGTVPTNYFTLHRSNGLASFANTITTVTQPFADATANTATTAYVNRAAIFQQNAAVTANTINCAAGSFFTDTISGNTVLTVSNVPAPPAVASFILVLTNGGSATITWWSGMTWAAGAAPTLSAAGVDILGFFSLGGTVWRGLVLGKAMA